METLKQKVEAQLLRWGNNPDDVKEMVKLHFAYAVCRYSTVKRIAECIRTIY